MNHESLTISNRLTNRDYYDKNNSCMFAVASGGFRSHLFGGANTVHLQENEFSAILEIKPSKTFMIL